MELCFKKHLQALEKRAARKGQRTRIRLRVATIEVLDRMGYHRMRITDIAAGAGISAASFYQYYSDKLNITLAVLDEFSEFYASRQSAAFDGPAPSHFEAIRRANLRYLQIAEQNIGVTRCLLQVADDEPEFARRFYAASGRQNQRIAAGLIKRLKLPRDRLPALTVVVYALSAMMDEIARRLLVQRDPEFRELVDEVSLDTGTLAEVLATIWYRALYADDGVESRTPIAEAFGVHGHEPAGPRARRSTPRRGSRPTRRGH